MGILTERPGLLERLSAIQNLQFFARLYQVEDVAKRIEEYLRLLGLWEWRDSPVATFSKGMKQKVAVARALLHDPEVLFLDEPTTGLDVVTARSIRKLIERLRGEGRTLLLTTHNLDEAERLADRIVVLDRTLQAEGSPRELRRRLFLPRLRIDLLKMEPRWSDLARAVEGVRAVETADSALLCTVADPEKAAPQLVARLAAAGARIRAVKDERPPLEEIYLKILGKGDPEG